MLRLRLALFASLAVAPTLGAKQLAPEPPTTPPVTAKPEAQAPFLKLDKIDPTLLGMEFKDDEWEFSITLPKDFAPVSPGELQMLRQALIPPESKRKLPSGKIQSKQVFKFADPRGATILVELYDPPQDISSPAKLRSAMLQLYGKVPGMTFTESGKLFHFQARGNRVGSFCEFDLTGAQIDPTHQYFAYLRAGSRAALAIYSARQATFAEYATPFQQSITQMGLRDSKAEEKVEPVAKTEPTRFEGSRKTFTILGNLALIVVVLLGVLRGGRSD